MIFGTEELAHLEMVGTIVHQLTDGVSAEEMEKAGLGAYYTDHGFGVYPQAAAGVPWNAATIAVKGDPIADLTEDYIFNTTNENVDVEELDKVCFEYKNKC